MKAYVKIALTAMLIAAFFLLSGFRSQTIIHDDGSETQDVLKVSDSADGQAALKKDADDFQKRSFTIMDYSNENGTGFRAMKTITKDGANKSSVDHIVHKTHDGLICSTYYIDYNFDSDSLTNLRLGTAMPEDGADLEYVVSFPAGTRVVSNSDKADDQGSTYMWSLSASNPREITLQATVWHKLFIYIALFFVVLILIIVLIMEHRRKNVISWKKAAHMRKVEMMLLLIPIVILGYMGFEYYVGTHVTSASLDKVAQQQQEELMETREEDRRMNDSAHKQQEGEMAAARIRDKAGDITKELRSLQDQYDNGTLDRSSARSQAQNLAQQAEDMLNDESGLSQADREVLEQLIDNVVSEAASVGISAPQSVPDDSSSSRTSRRQSRSEESDSRSSESSEESSSRDSDSDDSSEKSADKSSQSDQSADSQHDNSGSESDK